MTATQFRRLVLSLPEAAESSHCDHPDFRFQNRIFATLDYPVQGWGMLKLSREQQDDLLRRAPEVFRPAAGAWGRSGSTLVLLSEIKAAALQPIIRQAWENVATRSVATKRRR